MGQRDRVASILQLPQHFGVGKHLGGMVRGQSVKLTKQSRLHHARELKDILLRAGRGEEVVLRDLGEPAGSPAERAAQWQVLAKVREERGDQEGAADALLQAATDDPTSARWAARVWEAPICTQVRVAPTRLRSASSERPTSRPPNRRLTSTPRSS